MSIYRLLSSVRIIRPVWCKFLTIIISISVTACSGMTTPDVTPQSVSVEESSVDVSPLPTSVPGDFKHSISVDGMERLYYLYIPPGIDASKPLTVVFIFHDYTKSIAMLRRQSEFDNVADANRFLIVYPRGVGAAWNGGGCCGLALEDNLDDVEFIKQILIDMRRTFTLDAQRIYSAGFSNGALMAYRLGCEMSEVFAAIAAVQGPLFYEPCEPQEAVSLIHIHGLADPFVPYGGGKGVDVTKSIDFPPVESGIEKWRQWNGCSPAPQVNVQGPVTHRVYSNCDANTAVELYTLEGFMHGWPRPVGFGELNFPATQTIWDFFKEHPRSTDD